MSSLQAPENHSTTEPRSAAGTSLSWAARCIGAPSSRKATTATNTILWTKATGVRFIEFLPSVGHAIFVIPDWMLRHLEIPCTRSQLYQVSTIVENKPSQSTLSVLSRDLFSDAGALVDHANDDEGIFLTRSRKSSAAEQYSKKRTTCDFSDPGQPGTFRTGGFNL